MCLTEFVVESCVYYGCVPWEMDRLAVVKTGFPLIRMGKCSRDRVTRLSSLPNCPQATDATIGIHEPATPIKQSLSIGKSELTLARGLLATAKRAQGDKTCPRP